MLSPAWLATFIGAAFALPAKAMAMASALSGKGSPRLRFEQGEIDIDPENDNLAAQLGSIKCMSSFDSILIRPRESLPQPEQYFTRVDGPVPRDLNLGAPLERQPWP